MNTVLLNTALLVGWKHDAFPAPTRPEGGGAEQSGRTPGPRPPGCRTAVGGERVLVVEDKAIVALLVGDEPLGAGAEVGGPASCIAGALGLVEGAARDRRLSAAALDADLVGETAEPVGNRPAALGVPFLCRGPRRGPRHGRARGRAGAGPTVLPARVVDAVAALGCRGARFRPEVTRHMPRIAALPSGGLWRPTPQMIAGAAAKR